MWAFYFPSTNQPTNSLDLLIPSNKSTNSPVAQFAESRIVTTVTWEKSAGIICIPLSAWGESQVSDKALVTTSWPLIPLHYQRCQHVSGVSWPDIVSRELSENKACNNETIQMHTWAIRDTLDTLTIQSHDIIWIRHGATAHKIRITPRLFDSGLSNNAKCVSQPAPICHPVMHSEPLSPSVCLDVTSLSRAIVTWCRYLTECQPDTDWHWHLSSPPMLSCSPGQATGPTEQRSSAEHWPGMQPHKPQYREREGTQSGLVSSNFRAFSYEQISITTVSTWVHSTCWDWSSMIQYDHLMIRISLFEHWDSIKIKSVLICAQPWPGCPESGLWGS